jgi:hypothetical protein
VTDQAVFVAEYVEKRSRLTTFFRWFLAIPHLLVMSVWGFVAFFAVVAAWFAVVFTGSYPPGLYTFVGGFLRYATAVSGYFSLLTDDYPPFSSDTSSYPVQLRLPPAKPEYNRAKALFRIILLIPVYIIAYAMSIVAQVGAVISWFVIMVLGKEPKGLQDMIVLGLSYQMRAYTYYSLITEDWPPFIDQEGGSIEGGAGAAGSLGAAPERPAGAASSSASSFAPPEAPSSSVAAPGSAAAAEAPTVLDTPAVGAPDAPPVSEDPTQPAGEAPREDPPAGAGPSSGLSSGDPLDPD